VKQHLLVAYRLLKSCGKRLVQLRSDSAGYTADVINACNELGVTFTITADQDAAVKATIRKVDRQGGWTRLFRLDGKPTDWWYKTAIHCMEKTGKSFKLIILRWPNPEPELFRQEPYCYHVIATNDEERQPHEVIWFHNGRGDAENYNKELKSGFGMDYAPCRSIRADAVYFEIGVLAHNLAVAVKRLVLVVSGEEDNRQPALAATPDCGQGGAARAAAHPAGTGEPLRVIRDGAPAAYATGGAGLDPTDRRGDKQEGQFYRRQSVHPTCAQTLTDDCLRGHGRALRSSNNCRPSHRAADDESRSIRQLNIGIGGSLPA